MVELLAKSEMGLPVASRSLCCFTMTPVDAPVTVLIKFGVTEPLIFTSSFTHTHFTGPEPYISSV
jgi:hypothetical protein